MGGSRRGMRDGHGGHHTHGDPGAEGGVVEDALVNVKRCRGGDAAAEERLFSHVNDVADAAAEGWVCVREKLVGFAVTDGVAGPGADESGERGVSAERKDVDVELVAQEVLKGGRVEDGGVVYLGGRNGLGSRNVFALGGFQFQLDASLFRVAGQLARRGRWGNREDAEGAAGNHRRPAELAMVEGRGEGRGDVDGALEKENGMGSD
jgi:hypothetical protein